ncbi:MAG: HDOD domain-containing protein [Zoogloeaceae bacterium]|jgi:EAL and modified HD-GYP domain-containing signal transduction protein|nr:HDOD domain-containing protein [Zoogloeaceae bacterium]
MLGFLRGIFGKASEQPLPTDTPIPERLAQPVATSPPKLAPAPEPEPSFDARLPAFICREALVGRDQRILGYEFSHPQHLQSRITEKRTLVHQYYDEVLMCHLADLKLDSLLGKRLALIEITPTSLAHPALARLPRQNIALSLAFSEDGTQPDAPSMTGIKQSIGQLRANGMRVGLKWQRQYAATAASELAWLKLLPYLDFIQVAWPEYAGAPSDEAFSDQVNRFRQVTRLNPEQQSTIEANAEAAPLRLIASGLNKPDDFKLCYRLGFDIFRGPFINNREAQKISKSSANRLRIMQLLNDLRHDEDTRRMTQELRQDPVLSYRLLRYVNAPVFGLYRQIDNLDQALTILGRNNLYRWLSFLLFNVTDPGYYEWALTEQALARAALMERLGKQAAQSGMVDVSTDALFLTGLFSLLDQLMGEPLEELTRKIQIPPAVVAALTRREGMLAQFLALTEACESMHPESIAEHATALGLSDRTVNLAVFDALAWAHEITLIGAD